VVHGNLLGAEEAWNLRELERLEIAGRQAAVGEVQLLILCGGPQTWHQQRAGGSAG